MSSFFETGFVSITDTEELLTMNPLKWKRKVRDTIKPNWSYGYLTEFCAVHLEFFLPSHRFMRVSLHNLLKTTIDGASNVIFGPSSKGGRRSEWNRDDSWITEIIARKTLSDVQGVRLTVASVPTVATYVYGPIVDKFVPETKVPVLLWAAKGREPNKEIIDSYTQILNPPAGLSTQSTFESYLRFSLDKMDATDLDNHCIPTVTALASCLKVPSKRLVYLHAAKIPSDETNGRGVYIQTW